MNACARFRMLGVGLTIIALCAPHAMAGSWRGGIHDLDLPADMRLTPVGEGMAVNGLNLETQLFESPRSVAAVAADLRLRIDGELRQARAGPWTVLSARDAGQLLSVQMRAMPAGGTRGLLAISDLFDALERSPPRRRSDLPLPARTQTLIDIESRDASAHSHTLMLLAQAPASVVLDFYRAHFRAQGFEPVTRHSLMRSSRGGAMLLARHGMRVNVAVSERGHTSLAVIVRVRP